MCTQNLHLTKLCTDRKVWTCQNVKCAFAEICTVQKFAFAEKCAVQICAFCAQTVFAHLQICAFVFCACAEVCEHVAKCFCRVLHLWKSFANSVRICEIVFFHIFDGICKFERFLQKCRKSRNFRKCPENVRKKLTCSWVVHEWFLGQRVWQHRVAKVARICIN